MIDKEKVKDFIRNCSEGQYKYLIGLDYIGKEIYFYTARYAEGEEIKEFRVGAKYGKHAITTELFFLTEKDEKDYFFNAPCYDEMTPELGKYYLNKYSFLKATACDTLRGVKYQVYNQKGQLVYSWYE